MEAVRSTQAEGPEFGEGIGDHLERVGIRNAVGAIHGVAARRIDSKHLAVGTGQGAGVA